MTDTPMIARMYIKYADEGRTQWHVVADPEHTIEDALHTRYLWHRAADMNAGDTVEIRHKKHDFYIKLYIIEINNETRSVISAPIIGPVDLREDDIANVADMSTAIVKYRGKKAKWSVLDGEISLVDGLDTKAEAEDWLRERSAA